MQECENNQNEIDNEVDISNIIVNYADGTQRVIEKGFFCEIKDVDDGAQELSFIMCHCSGRDLETIVGGCIEFGFKLGMFDNR